MRVMQRVYNWAYKILVCNTRQRKSVSLQEIESNLIVSYFIEETVCEVSQGFKDFVQACNLPARFYGMAVSSEWQRQSSPVVKEHCISCKQNCGCDGLCVSHL